MYHNYLYKENARKFWKDYFSNLTCDNKNSPEVQSIASYVVLCLSRDISVGFTDEIRHYSGAIIQYLDQSIIRFQRSNLTHRDICDSRFFKCNSANSKVYYRRDLKDEAPCLSTGEPFFVIVNFF